MKERILSTFIDESGDFGSYEPHAPYYYVSLVLHDQSIDISENIAVLEEHLQNLGYNNHSVHCGPLIRRESCYSNDLVEDRRKLFSALFNFARKIDFNYSTVKVNKRELDDEMYLNARLSRSLGQIIDDNLDYFQSYDKIIVYYDNGQVPLTRIITSVFSSHLNNVEIRRVKPADYKLFQVADMICTMELLAEKAKDNGFSRSENEFFDSYGKFKKNYYKWIVRKKL